MAKDLPYYKFNVAEFLLGRISGEKDSIIGSFVLAGAHYWHKECNITRQEIEKKLSKSRIKKLISLNYLIEKGENIIIPFLDEQRLELSESINKKSLDGKKGAEKRWVTNATPMAIRERGEKEEIRERGEESEIASRSKFLVGGKPVENLNEFMLEKFPTAMTEFKIHFGLENFTKYFFDFQKLNTGKSWINEQDLRTHLKNWCLNQKNKNHGNTKQSTANERSQSVDNLADLARKVLESGKAG